MESSIIGDRYRIIQKVITGTSGTIYKAFDARENRHVAIKEIKPKNLNHVEVDEIAEIFFEEIEYLKSLKHNNLVQFYDAFEIERSYYYVTEWIEGVNLKEIIQKKKKFFSDKEAASIFFLLVEFIDYLHRQEPPYFLRNIKPSDIMVDNDGNVKVVDLNTAIDFLDHSEPGIYTITDEEPDAVRDIFFIGVVIYELVTGIRFRTEGVDTPLATTVNKDVSKVLSDIIDRCLATRKKRYTTIHYLRRDLIKWFPEYTRKYTLSDEKTLEEELIEKQRREKAGKISCIAFILVILALVALGYHSWPVILMRLETQNVEKCADSQREIAKALEAFRKDNIYYPGSLSFLVPKYLPALPECPSAKTADVYRKSYKVFNRGKDYVFYCEGENHIKAGIPANYPRYSSFEKLVKRPLVEKKGRN